ncbi:MAG: hypothetical protein M1813_002313 [Trichoglossum hirsutum]|nr:MAG: hypothetical protein M1813_002313 [Trichoglossum hirsutum]
MQNENKGGAIRNEDCEASYIQTLSLKKHLSSVARKKLTRALAKVEAESRQKTSIENFVFDEQSNSAENMKHHCQTPKRAYSVFDRLDVRAQQRRKQQRTAAEESHREESSNPINESTLNRTQPRSLLDSTLVSSYRYRFASGTENENGNKQDLCSRSTLPGELEGGSMTAQNIYLVQISRVLNSRLGSTDEGASGFGRLQQAQATLEATENSRDLKAPSAMIRQDVSSKDTKLEAAKLPPV